MLPRPDTADNPQWIFVGATAVAQPSTQGRWVAKLINGRSFPSLWPEIADGIGKHHLGDLCGLGVSDPSVLEIGGNGRRRTGGNGGGDGQLVREEPLDGIGGNIDFEIKVVVIATGGWIIVIDPGQLDQRSLPGKGGGGAAGRGLGC